MPARSLPTPRSAFVPSLSVLAIVLATSACTLQRDRQPEPQLPPVLHPVDSAVAAPAPATDELAPGTLRAFGLLLPLQTHERVSGASERLFDVYAQPSSVIRYLQSRLDIVTTDYLGPTGAMIRAAHVRASPPGETWILDVGVRAEGDHSLVLLTNRTGTPATPRSLEEGLRAAGVDPRTHQPLGSNNF